MIRSFSFTALLVVASAGILAGCKDGESQHFRADEPFAFSEVQEFALPIGTMSSTKTNGALDGLRRDRPQVARLYLDALTRFDGIYGDGVGPAKRRPEYLNCKLAFHDVATRIGAAADPLPEADIKSLWASLSNCRIIATRWAGPVEMATFGNDLKSMADGAMLTLSYAATTAGSPLGPQLYQEFEKFGAAEISKN